MLAGARAAIEKLEAATRGSSGRFEMLDGSNAQKEDAVHERYEKGYVALLGIGYGGYGCCRKKEERVSEETDERSSRREATHL